MIKKKRGSLLTERSAPGKYGRRNEIKGSDFIPREGWAGLMLKQDCRGFNFKVILKEEKFAPGHR